MPVHAIDWLLSSNWSISTRTCTFIGLAIFLSLVRQWTGAPLPRTASPRRLRNQTVLLVDPTGFSACSLPLIESLLKHGCQVIVLVAPDCAKSPRVLQLFALLKENGPVKHAQLYLEEVDLRDSKSVEAFAGAWAKRGAAKKGLMGEDIGSVQVAGIVFMPDEQVTIKHKLEFVKKLAPSLLQTSSAPADPLLPASTQSRVINLVASPFYAAASATNSLQADRQLSIFQQNATQALKDVLLWHKASQELKLPSEKISLVSLSAGVTRSALMSTFDLIQIALLRKLLISCCMPVIWAMGKSNSEAAASVEWLLVKPNVQAGAFYREGREVKCVVSLNSERI
jgi:hypothetical protein